MYHKGQLTEIKRRLSAEAERCMNGEISRYFYKCKHTDEYGDTDENYSARERLLYALRFGAAKIGEPQREQLVRQLFEQEIISREKSSFQGIGANLELLAVLMEQYRKPEDEPLYERAKNANYDCYCGFETDESYAEQYPEDIYKYNIEDSIELAHELDMTDIVCELVDRYKAEGLDGDRIFVFSWFSKFTGRADDEEIAVKGCYARAFEGDDPYNRSVMRQLSAAKRMIEWLCAHGDAKGAATLFIKHTDILRTANGRAFFEEALNIMKADNALIGSIWAHTSGFFAKDIKENTFYPVCYGVAKNCAELAGDEKTASIITYLEKMKDKR